MNILKNKAKELCEFSILSFRWEIKNKFKQWFDIKKSQDEDNTSCLSSIPAIETVVIKEKLYDEKCVTINPKIQYPSKERVLTTLLFPVSNNSKSLSNSHKKNYNTIVSSPLFPVTTPTSSVTSSSSFITSKVHFPTTAIQPRLQKHSSFISNNSISKLINNNIKFPIKNVNDSQKFPKTSNLNSKISFPIKKFQISKKVV
jgi:hypothetical protein